MLIVELLQKALGYFQKPEPVPASPLQISDLDQRVDRSRSTRAQIRQVLRRYEQGIITQAEAVEEILKVTR